MAELFSLGVYRVFRDRHRAVMTERDYEINHDSATIFSLTCVLIQAGIPEAQACYLANEQLQIWKRDRAQDQEGQKLWDYASSGESEIPSL